MRQGCLSEESSDSLEKANHGWLWGWMRSSGWPSVMQQAIAGEVTQRNRVKTFPSYWTSDVQ